MSFFSKLFGTKAESQSSLTKTVGPAVGYRSESQPIPGRLSVRAQVHELGVPPGLFLSIITRGLAAVGQREIVLTLRVHKDDAIEGQIEDVTRFLTEMYRFASEGRVVRVGDYTLFGDRGLLGQPHNGLVYVASGLLPGIELPPAALAAIIVDAHEVALVRQGFAYRVLVRRGERYGTFPYPRWSDLRSAAPPLDSDADSVALKVSGLRLPGVSLLAESGHLRMLVERDAGFSLPPTFVEQIPTTPLAFLTAPAPEASACLVWRSGQTEPVAITAPSSDGSRMTGLFLLASEGVERDRVQLLEDGFALLLSAPSWNSFWRALKLQQPLSLSQTDGMTFSIDWRSTGYESPVDGQAFVAASGWREFVPAQQAPDLRRKVVLLQAEDEVAGAVSIEVLAAFIEALFAELAAGAPKEGARRTVYVRCRLESNLHASFEMKVSPEASFDETLVTRLERVAAPAVKKPVLFELTLESGADS